MAVETITLYTARVCPYAHRTELALEEAKASYQRYEIDLQNKPEWYAPKVNPASKVPAIAYGGPKVSPHQPSPDSVKLAESLVLVEFIADLFPESGILPKDPVLRAKARFFIDAVSNKFNPAFLNFVLKGEEGADSQLLDGIDAIQALLPAKGFAVGEEFTIADIAILPFIARLYAALETDAGAYAPGLGTKTLNTLNTSPRFERFRRYYADLRQRESFKKTFDEALIKELNLKRFARK